MGKKCLFKTVALAVDEKEKAIKSSRGRAQTGGPHGPKRPGWSVGDMVK